MNNTYIWLSVAVIAVVTALLRFLPFAVWQKGQPKIIKKLAGSLPFAIMGMLVIYCLKDISFLSLGGFLPQLIACAAVVAVHIWKRNTLLSILTGTVCYMVLVQLVF